MHSLCFSWGNFVANLFNNWVKNSKFCVGFFPGQSFTKFLLFFYQTLSPSISQIPQQLITVFYPSSTITNNNKKLINLYIY